MRYGDITCTYTEALYAIAAKLTDSCIGNDNVIQPTIKSIVAAYNGYITNPNSQNLLPAKDIPTKIIRILANRSWLIDKGTNKLYAVR